MTPLEKAAKAVSGLIGGDNPAYTPMTEQLLPIAIARAVMMAVREPTKEMLRAGNAAESENYSCPYPDEAWPVMIDAILADAA